MYRHFYVFYTLNRFYEPFWINGCIAEVLRVLLTPILSYSWLSYIKWHICHIWHKWRNDIHHMTDLNMAIWGSKKPLGLQQCSHQSRMAHKIYLFGNKCKSVQTYNFLCIFQNFLCIIQERFPNSKTC